MKYPKIRYPSDVDDLLEDGTINVVEKLDGGNFRFKYEDGVMYYGTRNHIYTDIDDVPKMFKPVVKYIEETIDWEVLTEKMPGVWHYGEAMVPHTLSYDRENTPLFIGFDVYVPNSDYWLRYRAAKDVFDQLGFEMAPLVGSYDEPRELPSTIEVPVSEYRVPDPDKEREIDQLGLAEGVVIRNEASGARSKVVHPEFKERNAEVFGDSQEPMTDAQKFVREYVTKARIRKHAHKLIEQGHYDNMKMEMMERLPRRVLTDVMEEHAWEIFMSDYDLDSDARGSIRSETSQKCARVLKELCQQL